MVTLLLIMIYLAFIGLGLPDSLLGSAWPVMKSDLNATTEMAGLVPFVVSLCTVASSLLANKLLYRFGTGKVVVCSLLSTALALVCYALVPNFALLLVGAVLLGFGAGAVDAALSNYVALHFKARHMSWLHCFWGIGATAGPLVMAAHLRGGEDWRGGFMTVALILLGLVAVLLLALPLWKIFESRVQPEEEEPKYMSGREASRIQGVKPAMLVMLLYNGSETAIGLWAASYLIAGKGLAVNEAAAYSSLYFIGIIVGRVLSGFLSEQLSAKRLIRYGILIGAAGLIVLIGSSSLLLAGVGLFVLGFGGAPIYPSLVHMTPERFGKKASQSVISLEMASAYTGSTVIPLLVGLVVGSLGMAMMPVVILILFAGMFVSSVLVR